jgi:hypothetical protein
MEISATDECEWSFDADMNLVDTLGNLVFPQMQDDAENLGNIEGSMQLQPSQDMEYSPLPACVSFGQVSVQANPTSIYQEVSAIDENSKS